jgi:hypothetical protein
MDVDDVKALTESGQLQEFRDQDKIMLKVEQVDLLAGDNDDSGGMIPLADSGEIEPISDEQQRERPRDGRRPRPDGREHLRPRGRGRRRSRGRYAGLAHHGRVRPTSATPPRRAPGLANLALEGDDTSLGADLLEDVYSSTGSGSMAAASSGVGGSAMASGIMDADGDLFESAGTTPEPIGAAPAMAGAGAMMPEAYDGGGSGLVGGVAIGIVVTMVLAAAAMILMLDGNAQLMDQMSMNFVYMTVGIGAGVMVLGGLIGWFLLRKS